MSECGIEGTPAAFRQARRGLGLTQTEAAVLLGYGAQARVGEIETGVRSASASVRRLFAAYLSGHRPADWPRHLLAAEGRRIAAPDDLPFGKLLDPVLFRQARSRLRLTQTELATLLGYGAQARIGEVEKGVKSPSGSVRRLLAAYLDGYRPPDWPSHLVAAERGAAAG